MQDFFLDLCKILDLHIGKLLKAFYDISIIARKGKVRNTDGLIIPGIGPNKKPGADRFIEASQESERPDGRGEVSMNP